MRLLGDASQFLADGEAARAEQSAREALAVSPRGASSARAELVLGLALRDQERFAEAAESLRRGDPGSDDAVALAARFERAQALFYAGDPRSAASLFAQLGQSRIAAFARRARWRAADSLLEAGDAAGAVLAYEALLSEERGPPSPGARLSLATALRAAGDSARSVEMLRALWIDHPTDPAGRAAARGLGAWREAGGIVPAPTPDQRLARAARFLDLALPRRTLRALDHLDASRPGAEVASRSSLLRAMALVQLGRRDAAAVVAERLRRDPAALPGTRTGAELVLARVAARSGRTAEASRRYTELAGTRELVPGIPPRRARDLPEDARFLAAWLWFDAGRWERAVRELRAYVRARPNAARADDARWFEAWSLWRLGRRKEAVAGFASLGRGGLLPASLYWQARLERDAARARTLYRRVIAEAPPGSWYALLAADRLARGDEPAQDGLVAIGPPAPLAEATPEATAPLQDAVALLSVGLRGEALASLRSLATARDLGPRAALVAELAAAAGDAELPFRMARDQFAMSRRTLRWLYPVAYDPLITSSAAAAGCDRDLYLAVMRRESGFRPDARSAAGAVGLVQLIPPTAERLAALHGVPAGDVRLLEDPGVSVPLGAAYLALLADRFHDPAIVLAAYNAGPPLAATWARDRGGVPLDEWVEAIPYRETRRYVKNVLADAAVYGWLWSGRAASIDGRRSVPRPREGVAF